MFGIHLDTYVCYYYDRKDRLCNKHGLLTNNSPKVIINGV